MSTITTAQYWTSIRREPMILAYWRANEPNGAVTANDSGARYGLTGAYRSASVNSAPLIKNDSTAAGQYQVGIQVGDTSVLRLLGDLSLEAWIGPDIVSQSVTRNIIGKLNSGATKANPYAFRLVNGQLQFALGNGTTEVAINGGRPNVMAPNVVQATSFRGAMSIYLNGSLVASGSLGAQAVTDGGQPLYIGTDGSTAFHGAWAEAAIYSGALSPRRCFYHYSLGRQVYPDAAHYSGVAPPVLTA